MSCKPACATCESLRSAALTLVGDGGIEAVTEENLAAQVGLTPNQLADHYHTAAECLYDTYDEVACGILRDLVEAFSDAPDWQTGFELSRRRLLERMAANPAEARLSFVETVRGDRKLRRRRDITRRWIVEFLAREHACRREQEGLPAMQFELLIGAGFQAISSAVSDGEAEELTELEPKLAELQGCFVPVH